MKGSCHQLIFRDPSKCNILQTMVVASDNFDKIQSGVVFSFFFGPYFSGVLWLEKVHQGRARRELEVIYSIQEHEMKILKNLRILYLTISQIQVTSVWPHEKDGGGLDQLLFQLPRYPTPHTSTQTSWYWGQNYTFESIRMHWNLKSNSLRHPNRAVLYLNFIITFPFDFQRRCTTVQSTIFVTWGHDNKRLREDFKERK